MPVVYRYGETFEKLCGYYMSLGMGYHDYWDGDCEMARYYRDMDEKVKERQNEALWLQGLYFYEALVDASPVLNAMSKKHILADGGLVGLHIHNTPLANDIAECALTVISGNGIAKSGSGRGQPQCENLRGNCMHNHALLAQMCGVVTLFDRNIDVVRLALHHTVERQRRLVGKNDIAVAQVENIHIIWPCIA